ncbi:hypothetical protein ISP17_03415 [Dyella ginsengisoli]|uniref:HEPN domain-containing protein n=1 Tax=Dyella ginsengisoli TaxID=363848 RepID=A0ABW8JPE9_9GAMM
MNNWFVEPVWQNFSSMYREAVTSSAATTGMEIAHHRMAALYFGISAVESFLNMQMRDHLLSRGKTHDEVHKKLRRGQFMDKVKDWPTLIVGKDLDLRPTTLDRLFAVNALRGELTHQKNYWPESYEELSETDPMEVVDLVAEFIVVFHHAAGKHFPYWLWGWNYLNPMQDAHEIIMLNNGQFLHSLSALGYMFSPSVAGRHEAKEAAIFLDYRTYADVAKFLGSLEACEPKFAAYPYQPKLCRRWWEPSHQRTCGNVSKEAIQRALEIDAQYGQRRQTPPKQSVPPRSGWARMVNLLRRHDGP